jgi:hypothetical protein
LDAGAPVLFFWYIVSKVLSSKKTVKGLEKGIAAMYGRKDKVTNGVLGATNVSSYS